MQSWLSILLLTLLGVAFAAGSIVMAFFLGPRKRTVEKEAPYEWPGHALGGDARERHSVKFYLVAMIFLLFDIEVAFLYPWAYGHPRSPVDRVRAGARLFRDPGGRLHVRVEEEACSTETEPRSGRGPGPCRRPSRTDDRWHLSSEIPILTTHRRQDGARGPAGRAIWPVTLGLRAARIEMMSMAASRYDISRFGPRCSAPHPGSRS